jgi:predicted GIY-YIG superfamily endonuclease
MAINGGLAVPPDLAVNVERYAVYRCYGDDGQLLYVGETGDLGTRFASHAQKLWFTQVRGITLEWYLDELDALNAERRAIHVEHPKYNVVHRNTVTPRSPAPRRRRHPRPAALTTLEQASKLLAEDPRLGQPRMGGELARRLGVSPATGRRLHAKLGERSA